ncbi:MAG: TolC family protein [Candidatus Obscuribacterales bacterium]|nr:TolC family protein [Candidatus Obscuribacterales bacterium]
MTFHKAQAGILLILLSCSTVCGGFVQKALAAGREINIPDAQFQPIKPPKVVTLQEAVAIALRNYPSIANRRYKLRAALANVTLAKTQYLPNLNWDIQESGVTGNRVASVVMNNVSGFDTVPVDSGPSATSSSMKPIMNNLQGLNLNWLIVDGGLRHANDDFAYADARVARADVRLTMLDVAFDTAEAFLKAVAAKQIIRSAQAALDRMEASDLTSRTLVAKGLRPGADAAGWDFDVARAKIKVIKADKDIKLALVDLAEKMGIASTDIDVSSGPLVYSPIEIKPFGPFDLTSHPLAIYKNAEVERWKAKVKVLDVAYRPHVWLNSSLWGKGSGEPGSINPIRSVAGGVLPQVFNYMVGVSLSFPVMEYFPLKAEKGMAFNNGRAAKANYDLAMQILEKKDARARILLEEARKVAEQTPLLVQAAKVKEIKTLKRYRTGLVNMVVVAEAERALAEAEVEDALAQIEVWHSILSLAYVKGDLKPFIQLVSIADGNRPLDLSPGSVNRR